MSDMVPYVIRAGDYLTRLATTRGFDAKAVWEHAKNTELRRKRANPEILLAGDILYIPKREPKPQALKVGSTNSFTAKLATVKLKLVLTGSDGKPRANAKYWVDGEPGGASDGSGNVEFEVRATQSSVALHVEGCDNTYLLRVGGLDPIETPTGLRQRLVNLRYLPADSPRITEEHVRDALARFQRQQGLKATGELDDATKGALAREHGS